MNYSFDKFPKIFIFKIYKIQNNAKLVFVQEISKF